MNTNKKTGVDMHSRLVMLCEGAIMVAMSIGLSYVKIKLFPTGGSVELVMVPIIVFALRRGAGWGIGAGLVFGTLKCMLTEGIGYGWQVMILDYSLAYAMVGLAGLLRGRPILAVLAASVGRYAVHVLSGVVLWGQYMPENFLGLRMTNTLVYSLIYNSTYMIPNCVIAVVIILMLSKKTKLLRV